MEIAITDVLDLHSFRPSEVPDVVRDYLDAAYEKGFRQLRIIHGKGTGALRDHADEARGKQERMSSPPSMCCRRRHPFAAREREGR